MVAFPPGWENCGPIGKIMAKDLYQWGFTFEFEPDRVVRCHADSYEDISKFVNWFNERYHAYEDKKNYGDGTVITHYIKRQFDSVDGLLSAMKTKIKGAHKISSRNQNEINALKKKVAELEGAIQAITTMHGFASVDEWRKPPSDNELMYGTVIGASVNYVRLRLDKPLPVSDEKVDVIVITSGKLYGQARAIERVNGEYNDMWVYPAEKWQEWSEEDRLYRWPANGDRCALVWGIDKNKKDTTDDAR